MSNFLNKQLFVINKEKFINDIKTTRAKGYFCFFLIIPACFVAASSVMVYDSPKAGGALPEMFASSLLFLPLTLLLAGIGSTILTMGVENISEIRIFFVKLMLKLPYLNLIFITLAFIGISYFCGGSFECK